MRQHLFTILGLALSLGACALDEPQELATSTHAAATPWFIADTTRYPPGQLDGVDGWVSWGCIVQDDGSYPGGNHIKCRGGAGASRSFPPVFDGPQYVQVDISHTDAVQDGTIGKWSLEGPQGRVFQIYIGCGNLRMGAEMGLPQTYLKTWPCTPNSGIQPRWHRVACTFTIGQRSISCGAGDVTQDEIPITVTLTTPNPMRPFSGVSLTSYNLPGAVKFGRQYIYGL